ncbi:hypothetical protein R3P38DRAFT_2539134 [Favolaschia claudopus]|uniref:F-box domain-containing protein n=1 Tax=Favolaschia claudopus TaxID=2862362 RepID=A0AAW0B0P6_9AGAR
MKSGIDGAVSSTQVEWTPIVPTNAEVLADLRARLVELNLGISHLRGPLRRPNALVEERYSIRRTLDSFANHPVFRIPPEILQEIFFCCLPDDTDGPFVPSPKTAPLLLLNVCRAWREIALAAPHLWRTIRLNLPSKNYENTLTLFNLWLERAHSVPYSVAVVYTDYEDKPSPDVIIEALTQTSEQWQDVRLELPFKDLQRLNALEGKVPLLRKLLIGPTDAYFTGLQGMRIPPITAFSVAPLLREVRLVTGFPFTLELPWAQLTKLQATSLSVCECLDILEASPSLVECTLSLRKSFDLMDASPIPPLEHLEVFTLRTSGFHVDLLHCLTLPVLRELQFYVAPSAVSNEPNIAKVTAFLERSGAENGCLKEIRISGAYDLVTCPIMKSLVASGVRLGAPLDRRRLMDTY